MTGRRADRQPGLDLSIASRDLQGEERFSNSLPARGAAGPAADLAQPDTCLNFTAHA